MNNRTAQMVSMFSEGRTIIEIGQTFGVSKQRVHQLIGHLVKRGEGGASQKARSRKAKAEAEKDQWYLEHLGCTYSQWKHLKTVGDRMCREGFSKNKTPLYAFQIQRNSAGNRGIEWKMGLWEWWNAWEGSGKWSERGAGSGYVMCRFGDLGPYSPENVYIDTSMSNVSSYFERQRNALTCA